MYKTVNWNTGSAATRFREHYLKKIKNKSIKNGIDPKITSRIWKSMIWSYVDFQRRNFKKK